MKKENLVTYLTFSLGIILWINNLILRVDLGDGGLLTIIILIVVGLLLMTHAIGFSRFVKGKEQLFNIDGYYYLATIVFLSGYMFKF